jgi:zinc protease
VDILRGGLVTTPITPDNLTKVRDARLKGIRNAAPSPADLADESIRKRLLGSFPYSRPVDGTVESLGKIERGDLMLARERFLNANNATLTIIGGVSHARAMPALQQLLGAWNKSTELVPASFRQPDPPDPSTLTVELTDTQKAEVRVAVRGVSRSDPDYLATMLLAQVANARWQKLASDQDRSSFFARHEAHLLPGLFVVGASVNASEATRTVAAAQQLLKTLVSSPVSAAEFEAARAQLPSLPGPQATPEAVANAFLDIDTFGLPSLADQMQSRAKLSVGDVQRVAGRLFRDPQTAAVTLGSFKRIFEKTTEPTVQFPAKKPGR